jgi:hypothetical protein
MTATTFTASFDRVANLYGAGIVHLAWLDIAGSDDSHLLFGMVELLPKEVPAPPTEPPLHNQVVGAKVHLERVVCTASDARNWYEQSREGACPPLGQRRGVVRLQSPLGEEPPWPELGHRGRATPFIPSLGFDARIHHILSIAKNDSFPWPQGASKQEVTKLLEQWFHFDLERYNEYLGSLTLIAHNPILRRVTHIPMVTEAGEHSTIVRLEKRLHAEPSIVTLALSEKRPTTTNGQLIQVTLDEPHEIVYGREEGATGITAYHPSWGLLYKVPPLHFLKSVGLSVTVPPEPRVVAGASGRYEVAQRLPESRLATRLDNATQKLNRASNTRKAKDKPPQPSQQLAHGSIASAQDYVRRLIHAANREVYIIDPYFRESDVEFVLSTGNQLVEVKVLGSCLGFQDRHRSPLESDESDGGAAETRRAAMRREHAKRIQGQLLELARSGYRNAVELKVMPGRKAPYFHDRFIIADENAWSLGGSLSDLGNRLSVILQLPDPSPILEHAAKCWEQSTLLSQWILTAPAEEAAT